MQQLNFPTYEFRFKNTQNQLYIFDVVRKKFVVLQPEEWVRQHMIRFLNKNKKYPISHINVEKKLMVNKISKRYDIVVFNPDGSIKLVVECKAPSIEINQETFDQIARYNYSLNAEYLTVTNGLRHIYYKIDKDLEKYIFLKEIPAYIR